MIRIGMFSVLSRRLLCYDIMITIGCCAQQRLFMKRRIKVTFTVIKEGSESRININVYRCDLLRVCLGAYGYDRKRLPGRPVYNYLL